MGLGLGCQVLVYAPTKVIWGKTELRLVTEQAETPLVVNHPDNSLADGSRHDDKYKGFNTCAWMVDPEVMKFCNTWGTTTVLLWYDQFGITGPVMSVRPHVSNIKPLCTPHNASHNVITP